MSVYTPLDPPWANGPEGGTPVNATRLGHMETGIEDVDDALDALTTTVGGHTTTLGTLDTRVDDLESADTALDGRLDTLEASQNVNPDYLSHGVTGLTETIDVSAARVHQLVLDDTPVVLTINGWPTAGVVGEVVVILVQDAGGGNDVTWPAGTLWAGGAAPTLTAAGDAIDIVRLFSVDAGTTIFGEVIGLDMS
jgi:hypothetical protein